MDVLYRWHVANYGLYNGVRQKSTKIIRSDEFKPKMDAHAFAYTLQLLPLAGL